MYQGIIFDFFNVIYQDPAENFFRAIHNERQGVYEDIFNRVDAGQTTMSEMCRELGRASGMPFAEVSAFWHQTNLINNEVVEIVRALGVSYKIGLLSNARSDYLRPILEKNKLEELFDVIAVSSETGNLKPDPQSFYHILDQLDVPAEKTVFIDDNPRYVLAAEQLKITGIQFNGTKLLCKRLEDLKIL